MTDHYEHNIDDHEDPAASSTWLVGFIGVVLLVVTMLGVTALYYNVKAQRVDEEVVKPDINEPKNLRVHQERRLNAPARWVERDDGGEVTRELAIPLERAMKIVVEEYGAAEVSPTASASGDMP
ncbi:MAG: hypothetical protein V3T84_00085 [Phycisphaerales bacterium]